MISPTLIRFAFVMVLFALDLFACSRFTPDSSKLLLLWIALDTVVIVGYGSWTIWRMWVFYPKQGIGKHRKGADMPAATPASEPTAAQKKLLATQRAWSDGIQLFLGLILAYSAFRYLGSNGTRLEGYFIVGSVNLYVICLLFWMAHVGQNQRKGDFLIPNRSPCLVIVACLVFSTICAFGRLYVEGDGVYLSGTTPPDHLKHQADAVYFSTTTLATVGYGDYTPVKHSARNLAIWEISSGLLLLVGIVPLLISRLSTFPAD